MMNKKLPAPQWLRQIPSQFSWIDQQLVRGGHLRKCDPWAWALYLFLATVSDSQGLSYYSDASVTRLLGMDALQLSGSRQQLIAARLLAYQKPLYQLLALPPAQASVQGERSGQVRSVGELLRQITGGVA